jgi:DNA mismatch repair ATPase MutS
MSLPIINARLDLVSEFIHDQAFREHITNLLRRSYDCQRLVQKFSMGRGDGDDMMSLLRTIEATNGIASLLEKQVSSPEPSSSGEGQDSLPRHSLQALSRRLAIEGPNQLASQIAAAIDEEGLIQSHRNEQSDTASIVSMAQDVLQSEGSAEDQVAMSRVVRSKDTSRTPSEQDADEQDTWIMRRRLAGTLYRQGFANLRV